MRQAKPKGLTTTPSVDRRTHLSRQSHRAPHQPRLLPQRPKALLRLLGQEHLQHRLRDRRLRAPLRPRRLRQVSAHNDPVGQARPALRLRRRHHHRLGPEHRQAAAQAQGPRQGRAEPGHRPAEPTGRLDGAWGRLRAVLRQQRSRDPPVACESCSRARAAGES